MNTNSQKIDSLIDVCDKYDAYLIDMDGVIWLGEQPVTRAPKTIQKLKEKGKQIYFVTNNSSRSRDTYVERLKKFGIETEKKNIFCASSLACQFIKEKYPTIKKCYTVGMAGIRDELLEFGFQCIYGQEVHGTQNKPVTPEMFIDFSKSLDPTVDCVLCGIDYNFNYIKSSIASLYIQNGAKFIATNDDHFIIVGDKKMPGGGSCVRNIEVACGQAPIVVGKPNSYVVDQLCDHFKVDRKRCIMIGDYLSTDIMLGKNANIDTLLVLTGNTTKEMLEQEIKTNGIIPTYYSESL